nr:MAG TPA: hypothetical protein [Caudoviricetes sp.]
MRYFWFLLLFLAVFVVGVGVGYVGFRRGNEVVAADTVYRRDTVRWPIVRDSVVTRYVTRRLAVMRVDTVRQSDTVRAVDTIEVSLPIVQKVYKDTNYTAWVSGYEPKLDSITIANKIVTRTNTVSKNKNKRFSLGVQTGFNVINKKPYFGVGITYNIINF